MTTQNGGWARVSSGGYLPSHLPEDCHLGWAVLDETLSKYCGNQQPFIELLEEGPRSCQEVSGDLMLNLFFNTCWHSVLPEPGAGCKGMLALSCVLVLISQEDLPSAQGSDVKKKKC